MQRILIVVVALIVVWRILVSIGRRLSDKAPGADSFSRFSPEARRRRQQWSEATQGRVEELVECTRCGTFVPAGRALTDGDHRVYCSDECRHQAANQPNHAGG